MAGLLPFFFKNPGPVNYTLVIARSFALQQCLASLYYLTGTGIVGLSLND
jgi:hypothetical protein